MCCGFVGRAVDDDVDDDNSVASVPGVSDMDVKVDVSVVVDCKPLTVTVGDFGICGREFPCFTITSFLYLRRRASGCDACGINSI